MDVQLDGYRMTVTIQDGQTRQGTAAFLEEKGIPFRIEGNSIIVDDIRQSLPGMPQVRDLRITPQHLTLDARLVED